MSPGKTELIITHFHPAWKDEANYIFKYRIQSLTERTEWEQMWGKKCRDGSLTLCCIPFFAYGLALGDIVRIDQDSHFMDVLETSANVTIRAWTQHVDLMQKRFFVETMLELVDDVEMHSDDLIAFSVTKAQCHRVIDKLAQFEKNIGVLYEIANT